MSTSMIGCELAQHLVHGRCNEAVGANLDALQQVKDAKLPLPDGSESGVAELESALALAVDGPEVVEFL